MEGNPCDGRKPDSSGSDGVDCGNQFCEMNGGLLENCIMEDI